MPTSYPDTYFPVLVQIVIAVVVAAALVAISFLLGKRVRNRVKDSPYESGIAPTGSARERFSVKFYLVAIVFILFDIEAVFLYPWAVVYRELKLFGFCRNADVRRSDPVRILLHLEEGRAGLVAETHGRQSLRRGAGPGDQKKCCLTY